MGVAQKKLEFGSSSHPWQCPQARSGDDAQGKVGAFISPAAGAGKKKKTSPAFGHRSSSPCPRFLIISADLAQAPSTPHGPLPSLHPQLCPWQALGGAAKPSQRRCWDGSSGCLTSDVPLQCSPCLQHCQEWQEDKGQGTGDRDMLVSVLACVHVTSQSVGWEDRKGCPCSGDGLGWLLEVAQRLQGREERMKTSPPKSSGMLG